MNKFILKYMNLAYILSGNSSVGIAPFTTKWETVQFSTIIFYILKTGSEIANGK